MMYSCLQIKSLYTKATSDESEHAIVSSCNIREVTVELLGLPGMCASRNPGVFQAKPYSYLPKTCTHTQGRGFFWVQVCRSDGSENTCG